MAISSPPKTSALNAFNTASLSLDVILPSVTALSRREVRSSRDLSLSLTFPSPPSLNSMDISSPPSTPASNAFNTASLSLDVILPSVTALSRRELKSSRDLVLSRATLASSWWTLWLDVVLLASVELFCAHAIAAPVPKRAADKPPTIATLAGVGRARIVYSPSGSGALVSCGLNEGFSLSTTETQGKSQSLGIDATNLGVTCQ